jgi:hypothetical protein
VDRVDTGGAVLIIEKDKDADKKIGILHKNPGWYDVHKVMWYLCPAPKWLIVEKQSFSPL